MNFKLYQPYQPTGDQPQAIEKLTEAIKNQQHHQTLLGVTGSGKTYTMANVIANVQKPTLVLAHNKTLAAQLYQEFRDFFPQNAVSYFVSYYDYYQPEAYIPTTDTYIEKEATINEEIDKLRLAATTNLLTRRDTIVVSSVSCIYNLGSPVEYGRYILRLVEGEIIPRETLLLQLANLQYDRVTADLERGTYRIRGDVIQLWPAYEDKALRIDTLENAITKIDWVDPVTGTALNIPENQKEGNPEFIIYPAKHYVINPDSQAQAITNIEADLKVRVAELEAQGKAIEAYRLRQKVSYDIDMMREVGYVNGIENYSRYFDGRQPGQAPYTLIDYFHENAKVFQTDGFLTVIDESHITLPQVRGMYNGDQARKNNLIEYGFRLPSARDNRPLTFTEFMGVTQQMVYVSATPNDYEISLSEGQVVEQLIRPTGLIDPEIELRQTTGQIEDLIIEIIARKQIGQRTLVTTLTKKMAEALTEYLNNPEKIKELVENFLAKQNQDHSDPDTVIRANEQINPDELQIGPVPEQLYSTAKLVTHFEPNALPLPKVAYLHSDIETLERSDILDDLRRGVYDVVVGVNLLREGLDLPEVTLVAILDADKEGFLRSTSSLIQTMGRAARHNEGKAILYADKMTKSMIAAIGETYRRRAAQVQYNLDHDITATTISKPIRNRMIEKREEDKKKQAQAKQSIQLSKSESINLDELDPASLTPVDKKRLISQIRRRMRQAANDLDFELAATLRDTIATLES